MEEYGGLPRHGETVDTTMARMLRCQVCVDAEVGLESRDGVVGRKHAQLQSRMFLSFAPWSFVSLELCRARA